MKIGQAKVTTDERQKDLGPCDYVIYETINEALNHPQQGLGEVKLLEILNAQVRTNAMNQHRAMKTKGPAKSYLRSEAMNEVVAEIAAGNHPEVVGNKAALDKLIEDRMALIETRMKGAEPEPVLEEEGVTV